MTPFFKTCGVAAVCASIGTIGAAQDGFMLTSPAIEDGGTLPADLKCTRDGGDGLSPPLAWSGVPDATQSLAVIMHHYPRGTVAGKDAPSQYWLLWNIPADVQTIARGNPQSIGDEGSDKDQRGTGYTPPCSPTGVPQEYTITVYALNDALSALPQRDAPSVDWTAMTNAMDGKIIASAQFTFLN